MKVMSSSSGVLHEKLGGIVIEFRNTCGIWYDRSLSDQFMDGRKRDGGRCRDQSGQFSDNWIFGYAGCCASLWTAILLPLEKAKTCGFFIV